MPVCDGFESTLKIRELEAQRRAAGGRNGNIGTSIIIAFTGLASAADQKRAMDVGMDHFVTKPLRYPAFKKILETCGLLDTETE